MRPSIDQQALSNIFDRQSCLIVYIEFVKALGNNFVQILVEQLADPHHSILKCNALDVIIFKEISYS